jgi:phosphoribosyl-ATP pyrophosphohydrolase
MEEMKMNFVNKDYNQKTSIHNGEFSIQDQINFIPNLSCNNNLHHFSVIPTIDISKGRAVLVCQGKVMKDNGDPLDRAKFLSITSDFQVVDLDRAMEDGDNSEIIKKISSKYPCYVAGGIRNLQIASEYLNNNAKRVVISTAANTDLLSKIASNRCIVAFDIDQNFNLLYRGRKEITNKKIFDKILELKNYLSFISVTFHYTEGLGKGSDLNNLKIIKKFLLENNLKIKLAVAGGINSLDQINEIIDMGVIPQFGLGLWGGTFSLGEIYSSIMNYEMMNKYYIFKDMPILFPCVIIKSDGTPLGLTYTDARGIQESIDHRKCVFYSRDRKQKWVKGETSGNTQNILHVAVNCDRTCLLYIVEGGDFCHLNSISCFGGFNHPAKGSLLFLENIIKKNINSSDPNSYTKKIFGNHSQILSKILEEVEEISYSQSKDNLVYEISDLIYFLTLYSLSKGLEVKDISNELIKKHFRINRREININEIPSSIKLGICLNSHCEKEIFKFMEDNGIIVKKSNDLSRSLKYEAHFIKNPLVKIAPVIVKPKDVQKLFLNNIIDSVVCFQDIMDNYSLDYYKIPTTQSNLAMKKISKICAIANKGFDLEEYRFRCDIKLRIISEYPLLTNIWLEKNNLYAKLISVNGHSEGYLVQGLCDIVVCVVDSGRTVLENDLVILATVYESEIGMFVKKGREELFEELQNLI